MSEYDVIVIGAGPGGYVCAIRAAQLGLKTAIVDKQWLGGVCLNVGCIPSKALLKNAEVAHTLRERGKEFGFSLENLTLDYGAAVKRSRQISDRLVKGVGFLMKKNSIDVHMGSARVAARDTVVVTDAEGKTSELKGSNIVIATGASVAVPPGWQIDGEKVVTYLEAILQEKLPRSAVVIGAGAIGVAAPARHFDNASPASQASPAPTPIGIVTGHTSIEIGSEAGRSSPKRLVGRASALL